MMLLLLMHLGVRVVVVVLMIVLGDYLPELVRYLTVLQSYLPLLVRVALHIPAYSTHVLTSRLHGSPMWEERLVDFKQCFLVVNE